MNLRTTLAVLAFAASCAAATPLQAPNDAEALYRKMEAALAGAKKLTVDFKAVADGTLVEGTLALDDGNKLDLSVKGKAGVKDYTLVIKCDGQKLSLARTEKPAPPV